MSNLNTEKNTIYGIEYVDIEEDDIISQIMETLNSFEDRVVSNPKLFLTSRQICLLKFESVLDEMASNFNISKREYKKFKKLSYKLMFMLLNFRDKYKADNDYKLDDE